MRTVYLNERELEALDRQDPVTTSDNGWQALLIRIRQKVDCATGCVHLDATDLEEIPRCAFDYGSGGWTARLLVVFERTLGPRLGR